MGYFNIFCDIPNGSALTCTGKQVIDIAWIIGTWLVFFGYNENPIKYTNLVDEDDLFCYFTVYLKVSEFNLNIKPDYYYIENELNKTILEEYGYRIHLTDIEGAFKICSEIYDLQFLLSHFELCALSKSTDQSINII